MNRLIIIGNGFDLAHELETSYKQFLESYINEIITSYNYDYRFKDELLEINGHRSSARRNEPITFNEKDSKEGFYSWLYNNYNINSLSDSDFLTQIFYQYTTKGWVDIEGIYSTLLYKSVSVYSKPQSINSALDVLKNKLVKYLGNISQPASNNVFHSKMKGLLNYIGPLNGTTILNFNYTKTIEQYLEEREKENVIYIHGKLGDKENPIIFGYGDDHHDQYLVLQEKGNDELLKYQKSMLYPRTNNYGRLELFLDGKNPRKTKRNVTLGEAEGDFEVLILGHSCGLSDRTLLRTIFEHDNCKKIHIAFYNDVNDFDSKVIAISRHFRDKTKMRSRIAPFNEELRIPQFKEYVA